MKNMFFCEQCNYKFEHEGVKKEWDDTMYGKCWKRIAYCPQCKKECGEASLDFDSLVQNLKNKKSSGRCCGGGGCCG